MDALGQLSPLEVIEGKIQARVARFLAKKADIQALRAHPLLSIREEAARLYEKQKVLEGQLQETLKRIERMKAGAWSYGDVLEIGSFAADMEKHVREVEKLQEQTRGETKTEAPMGIGSIPTWGWIVGGYLALRWLRIL